MGQGTHGAALCTSSHDTTCLSDRLSQCSCRITCQPLYVWVKSVSAHWMWQTRFHQHVRSRTATVLHSTFGSPQSRENSLSVTCIAWPGWPLHPPELSECRRNLIRVCTKNCRDVVQLYKTARCR